MRYNLTASCTEKKILSSFQYERHSIQQLQTLIFILKKKVEEEIE